MGINPQINRTTSVNDGTGTFAITDNAETDFFSIDLGNSNITTNVFAGNFGIGTFSPSTKLDIDGGLTIRPPSTINLTADNQAITVGNALFIQLFSNNATATNRTFTLSNGLQAGQILIIVLVLNKAELLDSGNCNLASTYAINVGGTISLIWNGSTCYETSRSVN